MKPQTSKPTDEMRMPAAQFDRMMRGAMSAPPPKSEPKKPRRKKAGKK